MFSVAFANRTLGTGTRRRSGSYLGNIVLDPEVIPMPSSRGARALDPTSLVIPNQKHHFG